MTPEEMEVLKKPDNKTIYDKAKKERQRIAKEICPND